MWNYRFVSKVDYSSMQSLANILCYFILFPLGTQLLAAEHSLSSEMQKEKAIVEKTTSYLGQDQHSAIAFKRYKGLKVDLRRLEEQNLLTALNALKVSPFILQGKSPLSVKINASNLSQKTTEAIKNLRGLHHLSIMNIKSDYLTSLFKKLAGREVVSLTQDLIAQLPSLGSLFLDFKGGALNKGNAKNLMNSISSLPNLFSLTLSFQNVAFEQNSLLAFSEELKKFNSLNLLDLSFRPNFFSNAEVKTLLTNMAELKRLKTLMLRWDMKLGGSFWEAFAETLKSLQELETLKIHLHNFKIQPEQAQTLIDSIRTMKSLNSLVLILTPYQSQDKAVETLLNALQSLKDSVRLKVEIRYNTSKRER